MYLCQGSPSVKLLYTINRQGLKSWEFPSFSTVWTKKKLQCRFFFPVTSLMWIYISCLLLLPAVEFNLSHLKGGNNQWKPSVCVSLLSDWHLFSCFRDSHDEHSMAALLANFTSYQTILLLLLRFFFFSCFMWVFRLSLCVIKGRDQNIDHHCSSLLPVFTCFWSWPLDTRLTTSDSSSTNHLALSSCI